MKVKLMEMTLKEVREQNRFEVAVLPWGSCEPHNLHLPYGADTFTAESIAELSSKKARERGGKIIVLPTIPVGVNPNLLGFPLTLHLNPTTQLAILKDIVKALEVHGIYKLVVLNGHGGNEFKALLRETYNSSKVSIFLINWWNTKKETIQRVCEDLSGEHSNEAETSWLMYLKPELVHLEWADEGKVRQSRLTGLREGWVWITRPWHLLTTNSGYGNPRKANAEKGRIIVEETTDKIASFLVELSNSEIDEIFPY
ncbi:MAG TPA: creatininase family protein [Candidatus Omnitrophica bacterium]|nr:creatininase family protein [Candidatus Omnitrophota bacterium]